MCRKMVSFLTFTFFFTLIILAAPEGSSGREELSPDIQRKLEEFFKKNPDPNLKDVTEWGVTLDIDPDDIKIWLGRRRSETSRNLTKARKEARRLKQEARRKNLEKRDLRNYNEIPQPSRELMTEKQMQAIWKFQKLGDADKTLAAKRELAKKINSSVSRIEVLLQLEKNFKETENPTAEALTLWCQDLDIDISEIETWIDIRGKEVVHTHRTLKPNTEKRAYRKKRQISQVTVPKLTSNLSSSEERMRHYSYFTPSQLKQLDQFFAYNKYPTYAQKEKLANKIKVQLHRIDYWFTNERKRFKNKRLGIFEETRKKMVKLTPEIKEQLEKLYQKDHYPSRQARKELADRLSLSERRVLHWFSDRRTNQRKRELRIQKLKDEGKYVKKVPTPYSTRLPKYNDIHDYYDGRDKEYYVQDHDHYAQGYVKDYQDEGAEFVRQFIKY